MTMLDDPPMVTAPDTRRPNAVVAQPAAWRFAFRLARRESRRRPGRTVLASLLIAVPVMAMTIGSVVARSESGGWTAQFERRYGDADIAVDQARMGFTAEAPLVELPAGTSRTDYLWFSTQLTTGDPDAPFAYAAVTDIDLDDPATGSPIEVIDGRSPRVGEILLPAALADSLRVGTGDVVTFERPSGTWTVSGISRVRDSYYNDAVVIPGFDRTRVATGFEQVVVLYDLPDGVSAAETQQFAAMLGGMTRAVDPFGDDNLTRGMAWGWVAGALALFAVGIIVAAAFATSARRQLVTIGHLTANGATESMVRRTLALQGTWTGLAGAALGIAAGFASLPFVQPLVERFILQHDLAPLRFDFTDLVVIAGTATAAGTIAAAVPARSASRIPVMSALAGRRPLGKLPRRLVPTGLALLAAGLGLVAIASLGINGSLNGRSDDVWALLIVLGVIAVVIGMCCATPLVIERVGRLGRRASLSWRLALRSLARSRTRSSAVVAAIAVAVGGSVAAGALAETAIRENGAHRGMTVAADMIVLDAVFYPATTEPVEAEDTVIDIGALPPMGVPDDIREQVLEIVPNATFAPTRQATIDPDPFNTETGEGVWPEAAGPRIADPALLSLLDLTTADRETLETTGSLRPLSRWEIAHEGDDDLSAAVYEYAGPDGTIELTPSPATSVSTYEYATWMGPIVTEAYARELGFDIVERGAIVRSPNALTIEQRNGLASFQQGLYGVQLDSFIEPGDAPRVVDDGSTEAEWNVAWDEPRYRSIDSTDLWIARLVVLGAVLLLSLLVVSIGLALAAAEGRDERNVLAVVGATPASMRRQASARAAVLALSGIVLGIPTGFLPVWVLYRVLNTNSAITTEPLRFPWLVAVALVVAVPLLVAGVAWMGSGVGQRFRPPSPTRRD